MDPQAASSRPEEPPMLVINSSSGGPSVMRAIPPVQMNAPAPGASLLAGKLCAFPGCAKKTPTSASVCKRAMCKSHCIAQGGCASAIAHTLVNAGIRQQRQLGPEVNADPPLSNPHSVTSMLPLADRDSELYDLDFDDPVESPDPGPYIPVIDPDLTITMDDRLSHPRAYSRDPFAPSSTTPSPTLAAASLPLVIAVTTRHTDNSSKAKANGARQPKITSQMSEAWAAEYKIGKLELSQKAQKEKARLAAEVASKRCVDLVWWDVDYGTPTILALQGTTDEYSDIPQWPDFALTDVDTLLPSLGNNITAVEWFQPTHSLWKGLTRLSYMFHVKHGDMLLLRRKGVRHCARLEIISAQLAKGEQPRLFKKIAHERKTVSALCRLYPSASEDDSDRASSDHASLELNTTISSSPRKRHRKSSVQSVNDARIVRHQRSPSPTSSISSLSSHLFVPMRSPLPLLTGKDSESDLLSVPALQSPGLRLAAEGHSPLLLPSTMPTTKPPSDGHSKRTATWPSGEFVIDVVTGMEAMQDPSMKSLTQGQRFERVFKRKYVKSTFSDARRRWKLAPPDMRESLLEAGCTKDGLWDHITKAVKLKQVRTGGSTTGLSEPDIDLTMDEY